MRSTVYWNMMTFPVVATGWKCSVPIEPETATPLECATEGVERLERMSDTLSTQIAQVLEERQAKAALAPTMAENVDESGTSEDDIRRPVLRGPILSDEEVDLVIQQSSPEVRAALNAAHGSGKGPSPVTTDRANLPLQAIRFRHDNVDRICGMESSNQPLEADAHFFVLLDGARQPNTKTGRPRRFFAGQSELNRR